MTPMLRPPGGPPTGGPPPMRPMGPPPGMMHGNITHVLFIRFSMYLFVSNVVKNKNHFKFVILAGVPPPGMGRGMPNRPPPAGRGHF